MRLGGLIWCGALACVLGVQGCGDEGDTIYIFGAGAAGAPTTGGANNGGSDSAGSNSDGASSGGPSGGASSGGPSGGASSGGSSGNAGSGIGGVGGIPVCGIDATTRLSGVVRDPAGNLPLYNVLVYVPSAEPAAIADGVSCLRCSDAAVEAVSSARTDATGAFTLEGVPDGNVPLVIETGKWRRVTTIPGVTACQDNPISDASLTRLPRNQSEGHIPRIAVSTGHSDALECLLRKVGIDDSEFTTDAGGGRVHMFKGCPTSGGVDPANQFSAALGGASFPASTTLWESPQKLDLYDVLILSCEGHSCDEQKTPYLTNLSSYADRGGRILFDHMHYRWLREPDWSLAGTFQAGDDLPDPTLVNIDTTFPGGVALGAWLQRLYPLQTPNQFELLQGQRSIESIDPTRSKQWVYATEPHLITFDMPSQLAATPEAQCGRVLVSDLHSAAGTSTAVSDGATAFPDGCTSTTLTQQEQVLIFMLFELSACL